MLTDYEIHISIGGFEEKWVSPFVEIYVNGIDNMSSCTLLRNSCHIPNVAPQAVNPTNRQRNRHRPCKRNPQTPSTRLSSRC